MGGGEEEEEEEEEEESTMGKYEEMCARGMNKKIWGEKQRRQDKETSWKIREYGECLCFHVRVVSALRTKLERKLLVSFAREGLPKRPVPLYSRPADPTRY